MPGTAADSLKQTIESLDGVGPARARAFRHLEVHTLGDLLEYFPRGYQSENAETNIENLVARGEVIQTARGEVVAVNYVSGRGAPRFEATIDDGTGKLALLWFHGSY